VKIVHPICAGIDIHKKSFTIALNITNSDGTCSICTKTFSTMQSGILKARDWLLENNCHHIALESTGKYWIPVFNHFEDHFDITLANPRYTKTFPGNKTDPRDARWLSELHRVGLVAPSFIPPKDIRELRELTRYRTKLVKMRSAEKNRVQNSLTVCNIMISSVATDTFGKSGIAIINALLSGEDLTEDLLQVIVLGKLRSKIPDLMEALKGQLSKTQADKIKIALDNFLNLNEKITIIESLIDEKACSFQNQIDLLCTIPGIKKTAAIATIAEIGIDMSKFFSADHLCSWAGVCPQNYQSAGKKKTAPSKSGNSYLKSMLVQCANAAVKDVRTSFSGRFQSIKSRRGHNKAIVAICRSMLIAIFHVLLKNEVFREPLKSRSISISEEQKLINKLQLLGYKVEKSAS
jgi:transposase